MHRGASNTLKLLLLMSALFRESAAKSSDLSNYQDKLRAAGVDMLENLEVSYVYGGAALGDDKTCNACNECLEKLLPAPKLRFKQCPVCAHCSLDCSHFTQMVFARAGLSFPYITTAEILAMDPAILEKKYHLLSLGGNVAQIIPGDMLVYRGHVVIVEAVHGLDSGDIIHATGGKDIRGEPGQGIQRERFVRLSSFRGDLLKVIRHSKLAFTTQTYDEVRPFKMRPVEKKRAN
jgi:cell wall-associated NlpC family hydrolase